MHKGLRPWDITDKALNHLDPKAPWWGFEFETGWQNSQDMSAAVEHVWDNYDGVMFDSEGEGMFPVEITFIPSEESKYLDGTAPAAQFMKWVNDNADKVYRGVSDNIGTHWNYSHPMTRRSRSLNDSLREFLYCTLKWLMEVNGQRKELFGRETLYGTCYEQFGGGSYWLEFKTFRTVYTSAEFDHYVKVCAALSKCADLYVNLAKAEADRAKLRAEGMGVRNLYGMVMRGEEPVIESLEKLKIDHKALPLSTRDVYF